MRSSLKQFGIVTGFVLLGLLLIGNAMETKHRLDVQFVNAGWVLHSRQVLVALEETESTLKDAETGQRGFLLTGDAAYLAPYNRATTELEKRIDDLSRLTADNPAQQANITRLRTLAREKMNELAQTVALYRAGNIDQAKAVVLSDRGLLLMDNLRLLFAQMREEETRLDGERNAEYQRSIRLSAANIWLATAAAVLGLIALCYLILRERALREQHARELYASSELFRTTLTSIGDAVISTDRNGDVVFLNPEAEKLTGRPMKDAAGKSISQVFPIFNELTGKQVEDPVRKVLEMGIVVGLANHTVVKRTDGVLIPIEDSAAPIRDQQGELTGVVLVFRDVTDARKSEEVLRKTEKLAAAARLSATVAHEINNPLAAVVNLIFLAKNAPDTPAPVTGLLEQAEQELARVAHIARQALGFYRETSTPERVEIANLFDSVLKLYSNKIAAKSIRVVRTFENCPPIHGVVGELRQAISNLIANAIDAVDSNGTIFVSAHPASSGIQTEVELVVADDGPGVASEHVDRIFEPFFTTKKDVGTGLGLWAAKTIVERHGGTIAVGPGGGSNGKSGVAFNVRLPSAAVAPLDGHLDTSPQGAPSNGSI